MIFTKNKALLDFFIFDSSYRHNMVYEISGNESDIGLVDYTMYEPDNDDDYPSYIAKKSSNGKDLVYHPITKTWVEVGSFKQPSERYIKRVYNKIRDIVCWDATYGCFIVGGYERTYGDKSDSFRALPQWTRARTSYIEDWTYIPVHSYFKETFYKVKYPRFVGYFTEKSEDSEGWSSGFFHLKDTKTYTVPTVSGSPNGEKPSEDAVYDWWEGKWVTPGKYRLPGKLNEKDLNEYGWRVWDTALGIYRKPRDWVDKNWLDDYSKLIVDGTVAYGGHIIPAYSMWAYALGIQGDKYVGARADGNYAKGAEEQRAKLIEYMKGEGPKAANPNPAPKLTDQNAVVEKVAKSGYDTGYSRESYSVVQMKGYGYTPNKFGRYDAIAPINKWVAGPDTPEWLKRLLPAYSDAKNSEAEWVVQTDPDNPSQKGYWAVSKVRVKQ